MPYLTFNISLAVYVGELEVSVMLEWLEAMAANGSSELMFPITLLVVALGFVGLIIILLIGKGRAD